MLAELAPRARRSPAGRPRSPSPSSSSTSSPCVGHVLEAAARRAAGAPSSCRRLGGELGHGQAGRAVALGLGQHVDDRGAAAAGRVAAGRRRRGRSCPRSANPTPNTLVSSYGRLRTIVVRAVAVLVGDPRDEPRQPVRREQQVQRAGGAQRVPGLRIASLARCGFRPTRRNASPGSSSIDVQHVVAVASPAAAPRGTPPTCLTRLQVGEQRLLAATAGSARASVTLTCRPKRLSSCQTPAIRDALALLEVRRAARRARSRRPSRLGVDDREAGVVAREAQAADDDLVLERRARGSLDHLHDRIWVGRWERRFTPMPTTFTRTQRQRRQAVRGPAASGREQGEGGADRQLAALLDRLQGRPVRLLRGLDQGRSAEAGRRDRHRRPLQDEQGRAGRRPAQSLKRSDDLRAVRAPEAGAGVPARRRPGRPPLLPDVMSRCPAVRRRASACTKPTSLPELAR